MVGAILLERFSFTALPVCVAVCLLPLVFLDEWLKDDLQHGALLEAQMGKGGAPTGQARTLGLGIGYVYVCGEIVGELNLIKLRHVHH